MPRMIPWVGITLIRYPDFLALDSLTVREVVAKVGHFEADILKGEQRAALFGFIVEYTSGKNSRKESTMEAVNTALSSYYPNESSLKASQTQLAAVTSSRSLDMSLVTEEGDKVTFSMDAQTSAIYAAYGEVGMDDESLNAQWGAFSAGQFEREMTFTVEGDLNKQERREIRKVMKTINRMMKNFVQGKLNPMMARAQKLQGLETIDSLEVGMSYERQVIVAQQTQAAVSYSRTGEVTPVMTSPAAVVERPIKGDAEAVADDMAKEVVHSQAPTDPLRALADQLLKAYRDQAAKWNPTGGRVMDHIREMFEAAVDASGKTASMDHQTALSDDESV